MSDRYGPWIDHDGAAPPTRIAAGAIVDLLIAPGGLRPADGQSLGADYPGWVWRWRRIRTGWFSSELQALCDDPAYAPILRYRIRKPRGLVLLEDLLTSLPEEVPINAA